MIYAIIRLISKGFLKVFFNLKVYGTENIPEKGPFLMAANHTSFLDALVVSAALPVRVYWVALKVLYKNWFIGAVLRMTKCVPVNGATHEALTALSEGKVIGIFPEGIRTYDGKLLKKGKKGAAILAMRSGVSVLPAGIKGAYQAYPRTAVFPRPYPVRITFGKPLDFEKHPHDRIEQELVDSSTDRIMSAIGKLL